MKSMTGYGKCTVAEFDRILTVEIKTVNNRFLDINHRLPKFLSSCDDLVRANVKSALSRGSVDVYFDYENNSQSGKIVEVDEALVSSLAAKGKEIADKYGVDNNFNVAEIMRFSDVVTVKNAEENEDIVRELLDKCLKGALVALDAMRTREGAGIKADLKGLIDSIDDYLSKAKLRAPMVVAEYKTKIHTRVSEILEGVEVDEVKLLNEVAFFADKADINEEMQRLSSHIKQFNDILESDEPQGRKLDFLSQEINREINTMGSKSNDKELTGYVLAMKNQLEKIKEQIRNVE